jgi:hypothetical protein
MAKSSITKKRTVSIHGILDIAKEDNQIFVQIEDSDEVKSLAEILQEFDNCEVSLSVNESIDLA